MNNCAISGNSNGLVNNGGTVTVSSCVLNANSYLGLYAYYGITTVSDCVVTANSQGGLVNDGPHQHPPKGPVGSPGSMTIADSIISDNSGPGVSNVAGFLTVLNSTLSGNSAGQVMDGGGIMSGPLFKTPADVTLVNSTISGSISSANHQVRIGALICGISSGNAVRFARFRDFNCAFEAAPKAPIRILTAIGIGAIIGAGIFSLTGTAAAGQTFASRVETPVINFIQAWLSGTGVVFGRAGAGPAIAASFIVAGIACAFAAAPRAAPSDES